MTRRPRVRCRCERAPAWRRRVLVALALVSVPLPAAHAAPFGFDAVVAKAQKLAKEPFHEPAKVPEWLRKVTYDQWRDIRYRPERALWRERHGPFQVQFFHPGLFYEHAVAINVVDLAGVHPVEFSPSQFDYGKNDFASKVPQDLGFAGFRVHAAFKKPDYYDEVIVFLGASYFRALGKQQVFGMSARGLAIDTAESTGEEFPFFKEFWLVSPAPGAQELTIYAVLDSPSLAGAYRFVVNPGEQTTVAVDTQLFLRREVRKLGIAPLTSMFFHGENTIRRDIVDFRPESHDSDGLLLSFSTGEWLWRALDDPRTLNVSAFQMQSPKGFGLVQRDRDFASYQDLEARYDLRPSAWIAPHGDWGAGQVEIIEIPTNSDANDNIVAYWVAKTPAKPDTPQVFGYTMSWYGDDPARPPGGRTVATRRDFGTQDNVQRFVIDFESKKLAALPAERVLRGALTVIGGAENGEIVDQQVVKNTVTDAWRLTFQVRPNRVGALDVRAFLDKDGEALSETWSYVIVP